MTIQGPPATPSTTPTKGTGTGTTRHGRVVLTLFYCIVKQPLTFLSSARIKIKIILFPGVDAISNLFAEM